MDVKDPQTAERRFRALFDDNVDSIEAYLRRRLAADVVGDAVSEVFLVAWRRLEDVPTSEESRLWLFGVARNVVANTRRSAHRGERLHLKLVHHFDDTPHADADVHTAPVVEALMTLSDSDQELLRLLAWEELSHAEIARVLDISPNAVGVRAHRARQRLAAALERCSPAASHETSDAHPDSQARTSND